MSQPTLTEVPASELPQEVQVPTKEQLEAQVTQLVITRAQLKDQIDVIEKQLPSITSMLQLLQVQEAAAQAQAEAAVAAAEEVIKD